MELDSVSVKAEPGIGDVNKDILHTGASSPYRSEEPGVATLKAELRTGTDPPRITSDIIIYSEMNIDYPDIKQECLNSSQKNEIASNLKKSQQYFACSKCLYKSSLERSLKLHLLTHHTGKKRFSCSECQLKFSRKDHLKSHMLTHTGEKPFSCSECQLKFSRKGTLKTHMLIHTGEKPFPCSECQFSFSRKLALKAHMSIHTDDKSSSDKHVQTTPVPQPSRSIDSLILISRHMPVLNTPSAKCDTPRRLCRFCVSGKIKPKQRRTTKYICKECDAPLCVLCFKFYHETLDH